MTRGLIACVAYRALSGWLLAGPLALSVGAVLAHHPRGDAALFEPGGLWLLETARHLAPQLSGLALSAGVLSLLVAFGGLFPLSLLLAEIAGHRGRDALAAAGARLGSLLLFLGAFLFLEALILASTLFSARAGGPSAVGAFAFGGALIFILGGVHDAMRVVRFHGVESAPAALTTAATLLRRPRLWWSYAWRSLVALAALVSSVVTAQLLAPTSAGAAILAPQLGVIGYVGARAWWLVVLSRAARILTLPAPPPMH